MKRKLLITTDTFLSRMRRDGIGRFLSEIIPKLKRDYEITVIAPRFEGMQMAEGVKFVTMPLLNLRFADLFVSIPKRKIIRRLVKESDLIFNQTLGPIGMTAIGCARRYRKPVISYIHLIEWLLIPKSIKHFRWIAGFLIKRVAKHYYKKCRLLLVPTKEEAHILRVGGIKTAKAVVRLGTSTERFTAPRSKSEAKIKLGINPRDFVVGYHGRIAREKDLPTLLEAFKELHRRHSNTVLLIVGSGVREIEDMFKSKPGIFFAGSQYDVVPYLRAMDVYVLPSLSETTSLSTIEAMSCGLAVIATKVGFVKYYIKPNINGMFFPRRNSYILRRKLRRLMKNDGLRRMLGSNARETAERRFSWDLTAKRLRKILNRY
jgi:glycosyltransferase involved in cell wall biosynthesis